MTYFAGYTQDITQGERLANEVSTCLEFVEEMPKNEYWQKRLAAALQNEHEYHYGVITPDTLAQALEVAYMLEASPWTDAEIASEQMNRYPETGF